MCGPSALRAVFRRPVSNSVTITASRHTIFEAVNYAGGLTFKLEVAKSGGNIDYNKAHSHANSSELGDRNQKLPRPMIGRGSSNECMVYRSGVQEIVRCDARLFEDGAQGPFRHVARMIGNGRIASRLRIAPDLLAARGLTKKLKTERFEFLDDLSVSKACQPAHGSPHHERVIEALAHLG